MKEIITAILCILALVVVVILVGVDIDYEKTQCIESGGNWVTGRIGGELSYFCMPK